MPRPLRGRVPPGAGIEVLVEAHLPEGLSRHLARGQGGAHLPQEETEFRRGRRREEVSEPGQPPLHAREEASVRAREALLEGNELDDLRARAVCVCHVERLACVPVVVAKHALRLLTRRPHGRRRAACEQCREEVLTHKGVELDVLALELHEAPLRRRRAPEQPVQAGKGEPHGGVVGAALEADLQRRHRLDRVAESAALRVLLRRSRDAVDERRGRQRDQVVPGSLLALVQARVGEGERPHVQVQQLRGPLAGRARLDQGGIHKPEIVLHLQRSNVPPE
mmetsp:Transcript_37945/g.119764  ORF Transcript_37945/g.119764 Transcript_37945/m.119764 type:complete len:280 (-) Transcript_37945:2492-3331(-)